MDEEILSGEAANESTHKPSYIVFKNASISSLSSTTLSNVQLRRVSRVGASISWNKVECLRRMLRWTRKRVLPHCKMTFPSSK